MKLLTYHVKPTEKLDTRDEIGGAYVNCFIESDSNVEAERISEIQIKELHWEIVDLVETVVLDQYSVDDEKREYFEQALIDKEVFVFYTYPIEDTEN